MSRKEEEEKEKEEPASPGARLMQTPDFNLCILAVMGYMTTIDIDIFKKELERSLVKHPRFSSLLIVKNKKRGTFSWKRTKVDLEKHIIAPDLDPEMENPDQFIDDYISSLSKNLPTFEKPLWEVHVLNVKNSDANSTIIFKIDHSIGDGVSLISLVLACATKNSNPESLPFTAPKKHKKIAKNNGMVKKLFVLVWTLLLVLFNTLSDCILLVATILFLKDTKTVIKAGRGVESSPKRYVRRIISLDDVKFVKNAMNVSINDVVLGVTEAGLSRYLNARYGEQNENGAEIIKKSNTTNHLPKNLRIRSACAFNLRPCAKLEDMAKMMENEKLLKGMWGNIVGMVVLPLTIVLRDDPLTYIRRAKATMDGKKLSLGHKCGFLVMKLMMFLFGSKIAAGVSTRVFRNTTLTFSNVVGPQEEINVFGHPLAYIAPSVFGFPQGLVIHYQSYADRLVIAMGADEKLIPNPHQLCDDLVKSFENIKEAVIKKALVKGPESC